MSETHKEIARRFIEEIWNEGKIEVIDELISPDYIGHAPPETMKGREGYRQLVQKYKSIIPDLKFKVHEVLASGDKVVNRWSIRWTHTGEMEGVAPTGKKGETSGITILRIANGQVAEEWANWDALSFMQNIGAVK